jgi:NAD(P)-dependent dehydrogenase (short-subunit alcohol dehydrogenase family)
VGREYRIVGVAVITGSASGIGAAVRKRLEADGDRVVGIDLRDAEIVADLSSREGRQRAVAEAVAAADGSIDRAVLCAGLGSHLEDLPLIASVNYFGCIEVLDGLLPALARGTNPAVVALCSNSAQMAPLDEHPYVLALLEGDEAKAREIVANENGFVAYAGSKQALGRAVRRRAQQFGEAGVRLNAAAPGPVRTPLLQGSADHPVFGKGVAALPIPLGRWAEPEEISGLIAFMLGPEAGYMHGSIVYMDGGNDAVVRPERF